MEANNINKMREAVEGIKNTANGALTALSLGNYPASFLWDIIRKCEAILAAPRRQCDIGTTEEQYKRFKKFCFDNMGDGINEDRCSKCPIGKTKSSCRFDWAQMPYES